MRASVEDVAAMKARLEQKQEQRRFDRDADEAINMVHRRQPLVVEERMTPLEKREYVSRVIPAERAFSASAVAFILARAFTDNWLFFAGDGIHDFRGGSRNVKGRIIFNGRF